MRRARVAASSRSMLAVLALVVCFTAGCDAGTVAPGTADAADSPSPAASPAASPRPTPTPAPHVAAIQAFVDQVTGGLTYHAEFEGRVAGSANLGSVSGHIDTDGTDLAARYDYDFRKDSPGIGILTAGYREVDGVGYLRIEDQQGWDEVGGYTPADSSVPFAPVETIANVRFLETTETEDGEARYVVEIAKSVVLHPRTIPGRLTDERIRRSVLVLTIDAEGRPLSATWELDGTGRVGASGQLQQLTADLEVVFSKLGEDVDIEAP